MVDWVGKTAGWCAGVTAGCSAFAALIALSSHPWPGWRHDLYDGLIVVGGLSLIALLGTGPPALISLYRNRRGARRLVHATPTAPAEYNDITVPLNDGFRIGTLMAIEVRAHAQLTDARVILTSIAGPPASPTISTPARLYWYPERRESTTIAAGAFCLINIARVGPLPPGAVIDSPDYSLPWSLENGEWRARLQITAMGYPAQFFDVVFNVLPAEGIPSQSIEWTEFGISG